MFLKSTVTITITEPEFPEFITKFDPQIKLPRVGSFHGIYKPASHELTVYQNECERVKTIINDKQIKFKESYPPLLKQIKEYIEYVFYNDGRIFKWFTKQDMDETNLSISTRLMIDQYCKTDVAATIKPAFEKLEQGITHPTKTSRIIRDDDEFIIITNGYFLQMTMQKDDSFTFFNVTRQETFEPTLETYQECYEIGQWLDAYYLLKRI